MNMGANVHGVLWEKTVPSFELQTPLNRNKASLRVDCCILKVILIFIVVDPSRNPVKEAGQILC